VKEKEMSLVTVSKVKEYIKTKGGMNTGGAAPEALSKAVEKVLDKAMQLTKDDGRKTVFDRDIEAAICKLN